MTPTLAKDLVIGNVCSDVPLGREDATFFKFYGVREEELLFEHVSGEIYPYRAQGDGLFNFKGHGFPDIELSPSEIEQYLPKEKL